MPDFASSPVLVLNSGSSSLKFGLFAERDGEETALLTGGADGIGQSGGTLHISDAAGSTLLSESYTLSSQQHAFSRAAEALLKFTGEAPHSIGHRVVHGGPHLRTHQRITDQVIRTLGESVHFAPLHIPVSLDLIADAQTQFPQAQQFACFDTAFHRTLPEIASRFPLPKQLFEKGVLRYGFHGLSYESVLHRLGGAIPARAICAHLGSGASLVALRDGHSIDTSMGLTPTGGIPMATRTGDLDPGVLLFLLRNEHLDADALEDLLNRRSGLTAISGGLADMRKLQESMQQNNAGAALAIQIFVAGVRKTIGAYAAELGGLDLLIFTGGIGEHSPFIRHLICENLAFLGIERDGEDSYTKIRVMPSEEEVQIARHCRRLLREQTQPRA
ncbi:acetate/propionate family kinase [Paracidobacterium acidisoli]|uniref:Acetate kinase n=1 Tax=Paracidobacterium acidisoli TaxID=2303751 RepID=A0A372ISV8_9BACT|nr:acetate/propionate family kinase [Paracidobacterium acidisoli]MBT9329413.1 acetate/propionate family kinase [Paracidobacterium acidisoli]